MSNLKTPLNIAVRLKALVTLHDCLTSLQKIR